MSTQEEGKDPTAAMSEDDESVDTTGSKKKTGTEGKTTETAATNPEGMSNQDKGGSKCLKDMGKEDVREFIRGVLTDHNEFKDEIKMLYQNRVGGFTLMTDLNGGKVEFIREMSGYGIKSKVFSKTLFSALKEKQKEDLKRREQKEGHTDIKMSWPLQINFKVEIKDKRGNIFFTMPLTFIKMQVSRWQSIDFTLEETFLNSDLKIQKTLNLALNEITSDYEQKSHYEVLLGLPGWGKSRFLIILMNEIYHFCKRSLGKYIITPDDETKVRRLCPLAITFNSSWQVNKTEVNPKREYPRLLVDFYEQEIVFRMLYAFMGTGVCSFAKWRSCCLTWLESEAGPKKKIRIGDAIDFILEKLMTVKDVSDPLLLLMVDEPDILGDVGPILDVLKPAILSRSNCRLLMTGLSENWSIADEGANIGNPNSNNKVIPIRLSEPETESSKAVLISNIMVTLNYDQSSKNLVEYIVNLSMGHFRTLRTIVKMLYRNKDNPPGQIIIRSGKGLWIPRVLDQDLTGDSFGNACRAFITCLSLSTTNSKVKGTEAISGKPAIYWLEQAIIFNRMDNYRDFDVVPKVSLVLACALGNCECAKEKQIFNRIFKETAEDNKIQDRENRKKKFRELLKEFFGYGWLLPSEQTTDPSKEYEHCTACMLRLKWFAWEFIEKDALYNMNRKRKLYFWERDHGSPLEQEKLTDCHDTDCMNPEDKKWWKQHFRLSEGSRAFKYLFNANSDDPVIQRNTLFPETVAVLGRLKKNAEEKVSFGECYKELEIIPPESVLATHENFNKKMGARAIRLDSWFNNRSKSDRGGILKLFEEYKPGAVVQFKVPNHPAFDVMAILEKKYWDKEDEKCYLLLIENKFHAKQLSKKLVMDKILTLDKTWPNLLYRRAKGNDSLWREEDVLYLILADNGFDRGVVPEVQRYLEGKKKYEGRAIQFRGTIVLMKTSQFFGEQFSNLASFMRLQKA